MAVRVTPAINIIFPKSFIAQKVYAPRSSFSKLAHALIGWPLIGFALLHKKRALSRACGSLGPMFPPVATKDPTAVEVEVQSAYLAMFPNGDPLFVPRVFSWA